jgi:hypothetical protein
MQALNGKWAYLSFRHAPIVVEDGYVIGEPELAAPWSPPGVLDVTTSDTGEVRGVLTFAPNVKLQITGTIAPARANVPPSVTLTGEGLGSVNRIKGYFIPGSDHVVGTIMCTENDLLKQPNGTLGPFVLHPMKG